MMMMMMVTMMIKKLITMMMMLIDDKHDNGHDNILQQLNSLRPNTMLIGTFLAALDVAHSLQSRFAMPFCIERHCATRLFRSTMLQRHFAASFTRKFILQYHFAADCFTCNVNLPLSTVVLQHHGCIPNTEEQDHYVAT